MFLNLFYKLFNIKLFEYPIYCEKCLQYKLDEDDDIEKQNNEKSCKC